MSTRTKALAVAGAAIVAIVVAIVASRGPRDHALVELRDLPRAQLELHEDRLYVRGETVPFNGTSLETFTDGSHRTAIAIRDGRPHGISRGYYENGQLEVEEHFVDGVSHGQRTRWHENGMKKSQATIVAGQIEGKFTRWHDNGKVAASADMVGGQPHGVSEAFDRTGKRTARAVVENGQVVERERFEG